MVWVSVPPVEVCGDRRAGGAGFHSHAGGLRQHAELADLAIRDLRIPSVNPPALGVRDAIHPVLTHADLDPANLPGSGPIGLVLGPEERGQVRGANRRIGVPQGPGPAFSARERRGAGDRLISKPHHPVVVAVDDPDKAFSSASAHVFFSSVGTVQYTTRRSRSFRRLS